MSKGRFVSLEGGEGSGKSTQAELLKAALEEKGIACILTREPGGEVGAELIRDLLVQGSADRWEPITELLLFLAARFQHYHRTIAPALAQGQWVICDRYHDSTRVYQGVGRGMSQAYCDQLFAATLGNAMPDITFYFDIEPQQGLARSTRRTNHETRFESLELAFHQKVRDGFLALVKRESSRFELIEVGQHSKDAIHAQIMQRVTMF
ncbi:MAG: dTMP kinase [Rickettsiales bacterium]|nr:dTMP kinase [Rickettsiales bacterium]